MKIDTKTVATIIKIVESTKTNNLSNIEFLDLDTGEYKPLELPLCIYIDICDPCFCDYISTRDNLLSLISVIEHSIETKVKDTEFSAAIVDAGVTGKFPKHLYSKCKKISLTFYCDNEKKKECYKKHIRGFCHKNLLTIFTQQNMFFAAALLVGYVLFSHLFRHKEPYRYLHGHKRPRKRR